MIEKRIRYPVPEIPNMRGQLVKLVPETHNVQINMMENCQTLLEKAKLLKPQDRFLLIDGLVRTLDKPDSEIDEIWDKEAGKRLKAHREGVTQGIPCKEVFGEEL